VSKVKNVRPLIQFFMDKKSKFDYKEIKKKTIEQLRSGKSLFGRDGAFAPLLKDILEAALEGEIEGHLDEEERSAGSRKNGKTSKKLKTADGTIDLETPRDRAYSSGLMSTLNPFPTSD